MTDQNIPPSTSPPPPKKLGCLKIFLWAAGTIFFIFIVCVILVVQSINWLKNAPETNVASYPALNISPGEEEDIQRIMGSIEQAKQRDALYEEFVTPNVFNGFFAKVLDAERRQGKTDGPLAFRIAMADSDKVELKFTKAPDEGPKADAEGKPLYVNLEAVVNLEVVDGELRAAHVDKLVLRHRDAPLIARMVVNHMLGKLVEQSKSEKDALNELMAFKLLRREGDRIHFILDGKAMRQHDQQQEQPKSTTPPPQEKTGAF